MDRPPFWVDAGTQADRDKISPIVPNSLYLTNFRGAASREALGACQIGSIVVCNFSAEEPLIDSCPFHEDAAFRYYTKIDGIPDTPASGPALAAQLEPAARWMDAEVRASRRVLIHCAAGASRSATLVLYFLMTRHEMTLRGAFSVVKEARNVVWPNDGFMHELIEVERSRGRAPSITLQEYQQWAEFNFEHWEAHQEMKRDAERKA